MSNTIAISAAGRPLDIEYRFVGDDAPHAPWLIFLHEGLGSLSMWRDFPEALCAASHVRGLVYSRPGYGHSTARAPEERWEPDFMHRQANEVLPALLRALGAPPRYNLLGHSDGGSIALIHTATHADRVDAVVALAPHIRVEDLTIESIEQARRAYADTDLRVKLARYHADVDSAFRGWNDIWLDPRFRQWSIENLLPAIQCPVLAIQGFQDQYGTMAQIDGIAALLPPGQVQLLKLDACGHNAHRDQRNAVISATAEFMARISGARRA